MILAAGLPVGLVSAAEVLFLRPDSTLIGPSVPIDMTRIDDDFSPIEMAFDPGSVGEIVIIEFNFTSNNSFESYSGLTIDNVSVISK